MRNDVQETQVRNSTSFDEPSLSLQDELEKLREINERLEKKVQDMELLLELNLFASQRLSRDETLFSIQNLFVKSFNLDHYLLLLRSSDSGRLQVSSQHGANLEPNSWIDVTKDDKVMNQILEKGESIFVPDLSKDSKPSFLATINKTGAVLVLPLVSEHEAILGVIVLHRDRPNSFSQREIEFLQFMATHAAGVIDKSILFQNTQELAYTDALTGVFNRRYFDQRFSREVVRARRYSRSLAVLMIDIDHFKKFNDTFGHLQGDVVLQNVASILENKLRRADILCRYGGEEFVVLLPEIDLHNAEIVAEKLRAAIMSNATLERPGMPRQHITISVGVAALPDSGSDGKEILNKADRALYKAKEGGRNKVCVAH